MKTTMKKMAACLLVLLLVFQMTSAFAKVIISDAEDSIDIESFRDTLEVKSSVQILPVGGQVQLTATQGYTLAWSCDPEGIAEVDENGLVTAVAPGQVKITGSEGVYRDSVTIKVIGTEDPAEEKEQTGDKMIIVINAGKDKYTYDGTEKVSTFTAVSNAADFDASRVAINPGKLVKGTDCQTYPVKYSAEDFTYDGSRDNVEFIVSDGWIQIKPVTVTVKPDDATKWEGDPNPAFTYTVTGLLNGDSIDLGNIKYIVTPINETTQAVLPDIDENLIVGNYRVKAAQGILTIQPLKEEYLYNIAKINNAYYRLARTTFKTKIPDITPYIVDKNGKTINLFPDKSLYQVEPYVFDDVVINLYGKTYYYNCQKNAEKILKEGADYYTITKTNPIQAIKGKISSSNNWLVPEDQRYKDPANKDSYHRDFEIALHENTLVTEEQTIYNMLCVNGNKDWYRLKPGTITAVPFDQAGSELKAGEYLLDAYDFTNVKLVIDGEIYTYSDHEITDEYYDNYYTVYFDKVVKETLINKNAKWFTDAKGWLDGAEALYGGIGNNTPGYHANYKATTHKGVKAPEVEEVDTTGMSIYVTSSWPAGKPGYRGEEITLTAHLTGFEGRQYRLQWQYTDGTNDWTDIPGASGETYTYTLDENTTKHTWRVVALDIQ